MDQHLAYYIAVSILILSGCSMRYLARNGKQAVRLELLRVLAGLRTLLCPFKATTKYLEMRRRENTNLDQEEGARG